MTNFKSISSKMVFISFKSFKNAGWKNFEFIFFFLPKYATQKDENSTIELPAKLCIEGKLFMAKITTLKLSPGISNNHVLTLKLTLTSHLTFKKNKDSSEPSR